MGKILTLDNVPIFNRKIGKIDTIDKLLKSVNYKVGDIVDVLGYYTIGDGAGHPRQKKPTGYTGKDAIIGADGSIWAIVHNGEVNVSWFGARGDGMVDDTLAIQKAIVFAESFITSDPYQEETGGKLSGVVKFGKGIFLVSKLTINESGLKLWGSGKDNTLITSNLVYSQKVDYVDNIVENSVITSNKDSYKHRIEITNISIKANKQINLINLISIGQSKIQDVCLYGNERNFGFGIVCGSIKRSSDNLQIAGHLNTIDRVMAFNLEYGIFILGGSNANKIYNTEVIRSKYGVYIDNFKINGLTGGSNSISNGCRFENCETGVFTNGNYNRISDVYLDLLTNGIILGQENAYSEIYGIHYSPSVANVIVDLRTASNRQSTITGHYKGGVYCEAINFANGAIIKGWLGTNYISLDKDFRVPNIDVSERAWVGLLRLDTGKTVGSNRNTFFLNSNNDLSFVDKNGATRQIAFSASVLALDTPYYATKMQEQGILGEYYAYLDELHEYEKSQNSDIMTLEIRQKPVLPKNVEKFVKEYNLL